MEINIETAIDSSVDSIWEAWTKNELITKWFSPEANIEPRVGGAFELFFDPSNHNHECTKGCVFTKVEKNRILEFTWKGPGQFSDFMNNPSSLTTVKLEFFVEGEKTKLKFEHSGWGDSVDWDKARNWHEEQWNAVLNELKKYIES